MDNFLQKKLLKVSQSGHTDFGLVGWWGATGFDQIVF